jgi:hypothetical protein
MGSAMVTDKMGRPPQKRGGEENRKSTIRNRETGRVDFRGVRRLARVCASKPEHVMSFRGPRCQKYCLNVIA